MNDAATLRLQAETLRAEFSVLARQWNRDTMHLSRISRAVAHPAHVRIVAMGEPVVPLILEELRDCPSHWFAALWTITNIDPVPAGANVCWQGKLGSNGEEEKD